MNRHAWVGPIGAIFIVTMLLLAAAFAIAPRACQGGLDVYFWCGVAAILVMVVVPFVLRSGGSLLMRGAVAVGLGVCAAAAWIGGLVAADVHILCRLF